MSITRNFGPVPTFERVRIGQYDPMSVNGTPISSHVAVNASAESAVVEIHTHINNSSGGILYGAKSRGTTSSPVIVNNGDELFGFWGVAHDGFDYAVAAFIKFAVDGTPGSNDMPGRITFSTSPAGTQSPVERLRIASDGVISVSNGYITSPDSGTDSERFGEASSATGDYASAFGNLAVGGKYGVALGYNSIAGEECVSVGAEASSVNASGPTFGSTAIGYLADASNDNSLACGNNSAAGGISSLAFGSFAVVGASNNATAIGAYCTIGDTCTSSVAVGSGINIADGSTNCIAFGPFASISGGADNVLSLSGTSAFSNTIVMGRGATSTATNQCVIGGSTCNITTLYVGKGVTNATPDAIVTITTTGETGTNQAGSTLNIQGGATTGSHTGGGTVTISTGAVGSSGTTPQTPVIRATWYTDTGGGFVGNEGAANYDHRWEGQTDTAVFAIDASADCAGFSTTAPLVKCDVNGGLATRWGGSATSLTADNQAVTVGNRSRIVLSSNDTTATNRTFTLSNGLTDGQFLVLEWSHATNRGEIVAASNIKLSATWSPDQYDTLTLQWSASASAWVELCRSANA